MNWTIGFFLASIIVSFVPLVASTRPSLLFNPAKQQYITLPSSYQPPSSSYSGPGGFTVEVWANITSSNSPIYQFYSTVDNTGPDDIAAYMVSGYLRQYNWAAGTDTPYPASQGAALSLNDFHQFSISQGQAYIAEVEQDGVSIWSTSDLYPYESRSPTRNYEFIGGIPNGNHLSGAPGSAYFSGNLGQIRIWTSYRSHAAIASDWNVEYNYTAGLPSGLAALYQMDKVCGNYLLDLSGNGRHALLNNFVGTDLPVSCSGRGTCSSTTCVCWSNTYSGYACESGGPTLSTTPAPSTAAPTAPAPTAAPRPRPTLLFQPAKQQYIQLTGNYQVPLSSYSGAGGFTFEVWANITSNNSPLLQLYSTVDNTGPDDIADYLVGGYLKMYNWASGSDTPYPYSAGAQVYQNGFHQLSISQGQAYSAEVLEDGASIWSTGDLFPYEERNANRNYAYIGGIPNSGHLSGAPGTAFFSGHMGQIRLWTVSRSDSDIASDWNVEYNYSTGLPANLGALYQMDKACGSYLLDLTGHGYHGLLMNFSPSELPVSCSGRGTCNSSIVCVCVSSSYSGLACELGGPTLPVHSSSTSTSTAHVSTASVQASSSASVKATTIASHSSTTAVHAATTTAHTSTSKAHASSSTALKSSSSSSSASAKASSTKLHTSSSSSSHSATTLA